MCPMNLASLEKTDPVLAEAMANELKRQQTTLELIPSENFASPAVMAAQASVMTNKYAEGYPGKRYYGGCEFVDVAEELAIERACRLFGADFANVQPHAGSQTNHVIFNAFLQPGDRILGMSLADGGHLTHGHPVNFSGRWYDAHFYGVTKETEEIDYDALATQAKEVKPKLITIGASAYSRTIHFDKMRQIADDVGAYLLADVAHIAGLIAAGVHPNPLPYADFVTSTTHKTLRGPRGGIILWNNPEYTKPINSSLFPGMQGGPLMHVIAAKAVAFQEALQPAFKDYCQNVIHNAQTLAQTLQDEGIRVISGGTDNHLLMIDVWERGVTGKDAQEACEAAHITLNRNMIPFDTRKPMNPSGLRLGSPAMTTRGFGETEFKNMGHMMARIIDALASGENVEQTTVDIRQKVLEMCSHYPLYPDYAGGLPPLKDAA